MCSSSDMLHSRDRSNDKENNTPSTIISISSDTDDDLYDGKDDRPMKVISIDVSQQEYGHRPLAPEVLEFWHVDRILERTACHISTLENPDGDRCSTNDDLSSTAQTPTDDNDIVVDIEKQLGPSFMKAEKIDPIKSGFFTPQRERKQICSISRAVRELEGLAYPPQTINDLEKKSISENIQQKNFISYERTRLIRVDKNKLLEDIKKRKSACFVRLKKNRCLPNRKDEGDTYSSAGIDYDERSRSISSRVSNRTGKSSCGTYTTRDDVKTDYDTVLLSSNRKITKAGWITRQFGREGRRDKFSGAQTT